MSKLGQYRKSGAALIGSVLTWAGAAYVPTGHVNRPEWYALAVALATALGVYSVSNSPAPVKADAVGPDVVAPVKADVVAPAAEVTA